MTWVGWMALFVLVLAFMGNWAQYKGYKQLDDERVRKYAIGGLAIGILLNALLLVGVLFVGTPPLF